MALTYICIPTNYTYANINSLSADSVNPQPKFIDKTSWSSTKIVNFMAFGYQYTQGSTPPQNTPLYAVYLISSSVSGSDIPSCWLQDGGPSGTNSTHVSTPSSYSDATNVWTHLESGNITPMQIYVDGQTTEISTYLFEYDAEYGAEEEENIWEDYSGNLVGGTYKRQFINTSKTPSVRDTTGNNFNQSVGSTRTGIVEIVHDMGNLSNPSLKTGFVSNNTPYANNVLNKGYVYSYSDHDTDVNVEISGNSRKVFAFHNLKFAQEFGGQGSSISERPAYYGSTSNTLTSNPSRAFVGYSSPNGTTFTSANTWVTHTAGDGKKYYAITVTTNSILAGTTLSVTAGYQYTFNVYTHSEASGDGIILSTTQISTPPNQIGQSGFARFSGVSSYGTYTYIPSSSGTVYIYFSTNASILSGGWTELSYDSNGDPVEGERHDEYEFGDIEVVITATDKVVTLNDNGGSGGDGSINVTSGTISNSLQVTIPYRGTSPRYYGFLGYYTVVAKTGGVQVTDSNGNGTGNVTISSNVTWYARWKNTIYWSPSTSVSCTYSSSQQDVTIASTAAACASGGTISYTITSIKKGTTTQSITGWSVNGTTLHVPSAQATGTYTIVVGTTSPASTSNSSNTYVSGALTKTITLTISTGNITITLNKNGGGSNSTITVTPGAAAGSWSVGTVPTRTGYTFKGYYQNQSNTSAGTQYTNGSGTTIAAAPASSTTIYAHWQPVITYNPSQTVTAYCTTGNHEASVTDDDIQVNLTSTAGSGPSGVTLYYYENNETWDVTTDGKALIVPEGVSAGTYYLEVSVYINAPEGANYDGTYTDIPITLTLNANVGTWANPTVSHTTPISLNKAGETYTMSPTLSQTCTYSNGTTSTNTSGTYTYAVQTSKTGYSLSSNSVTVTNNTSTSARNGFVVRITGSANGKSGTKDVTFNQPAGSKVYANPTVSTYYYADFAAAGETKTPTIEYSQSWTWNGVSGSGGDPIISGGTLAFTAGTLPSGFSKGTNFATTGNATWGNNTTTSTRDAKSILSVTVTLNSKTSSAKTCTSCKQNAGSMVWETPNLEVWTYPSFAAAGATNTPYSGSTCSWSQQYTWNGVSGSGGAIGDWDYSGYTVTWSYTKGTLPTGCTAGSDFATTGSITWANNTTTSARDAASVLSATITVNGKTSNSSTCYECKQDAGVIVYTSIIVSLYRYKTNIVASGATISPSNKSYRLYYKWNNTGNTLSQTTGATVTFSATTAKKDYVTLSTDFSTTGKITVANRGTIVGSSRDFYTGLYETVAYGNLTSTKQATAGKQVANAVTSVTLAVDPSEVSYGETANADVTAYYTSTASSTVTTNVTFSTNPSDIVTIS